MHVLTVVVRLYGMGMMGVRMVRVVWCAAAASASHHASAHADPACTNIQQSSLNYISSERALLSRLMELEPE